MKKSLTQISDQANITFSNDSFLENDPPKYESTLDDLYKKYRGRTLANPNPANVTQIKNPVIPGYIKVKNVLIQYYGDKSTLNTAQYAIAQEYNTTITTSKSIARQVKQYSTSIKQNIGNISNQLDTISNQMISLNNTVNQFSENVIGSLVNAVR